MASVIKIKSGSAEPASDALVKGELAIRHRSSHHTTNESSRLYFGEDRDDNGVVLRQFGFGITDGSTQSGVALGENLTFTAGSGISLSLGGTGDRELTITASGGGVSLANDANNRVVTADGSGGINGEANLTFDGTDLTIGGGTDTDHSLKFNANSNDGVLTWMEDEDYFQFSDDVLMTDGESVQFFSRTGVNPHKITTKTTGTGSGDDNDTLLLDGLSYIELNASKINLRGTYGSGLDVQGSISCGSLTAEGNVTFGGGASGYDYTITFDGQDSDGVLRWMEDEDYFKFHDDLLIDTTEKLLFRDDSSIYINSSADGQLDIVADTEVQIAATTIDMNGAADISGNLTVGGNINVTGATNMNGSGHLGDNDYIYFGASNDYSLGFVGDSNFLVFAQSADSSPFGIVFKADGGGDDAGDEWKMDIADGGVMSWGNDIASASTYVTHFSITPNATVANSTFAMAGHATVGNNLTVGGNLTATGVSIGLGDGSSSTDTTLTFNSSGNDGVLFWDQSADKFEFSDSIQIASNKFLYFRDGGSYIHSNDSNDLRVVGTDIDLRGSAQIFLDTPIVDLTDDGVILKFGADDDVTLTHVADTGLLLNSSRQLQFGDSGTYIHQSADGVLDLVSDTEIEINATTIDMNGAVDISGALTVNGNLNFAGEANHIGDTNTKFSFTGNDTISIQTGGTERVSITDAGTAFGTGARITTILDEDNMASDSATALATQQSIKAYVDANAGGSGDITSVVAGDGMTGGATTGDATLNVVAGDGITMNPNSVAVSAAQTTITSILNSSLVVGRGTSHANIDFSTDNQILFDIDGTQQIKFADGSIQPVTNNDIDLGADGKQFKDLYIDGTANIDTANIGSLLFTTETGTMISFGADLDQFMNWDNSEGYFKWGAKSGTDLGIVFNADTDVLSPDNGDMWKMNFADGGTFTFANDKSGSFVNHLSITPNATVTNSTFAIAGHATVGHDLTVTGDLAVTGSYGLASGDIPNNAADTTGNAATATALATARAFQTNLASTSSANFDGSAANTHGVTGTLAVGNGGTGVTSMTSLKNALDDETWTFANVLTADAGIDVDDIHIDDNTVKSSSGSLKLSANEFNFHSPAAGVNVITVTDPSDNDVGGTNHGYTMKIKGTNSHGGGMIVFGGASDTTANTVTGFRAPNVLPQSLIYELPDDVPSAGEYLKVASYSSPVAQLEWASASGGGGGLITSSTRADTNAIAFYGSDNATLSSDSGLTYDGTTLAVEGSGSEATFIKARSTANNSSSLDGPRIDLDRYPTSDPGQDGDELGRMRFNGKTGANGSRTFGSFMCSIVDAGPDNSNASGKFTFQARINGSTRDIFSAGSNGPSDSTQQKAVFPEDDNDVDLGTSSKGWERVYARTYFTWDGSQYIEGSDGEASGLQGTIMGSSATYAMNFDNGILTAISAMQGSDEGIKTDITDAGTGLSFVKALKPKTFKFKDDFRAAHGLTGDSKTQYGFIAQDLQAISSDYVNTVTDPRDENETILAIDEKFEGELKASLIKAIQELSAKNDALEARIAALEG